MEKPDIPQKGPYKIKVRKSETYFWCSCGLSQKQPFCDGSHSKTSFTPIKFVSDENKKVYFCVCKKSGNAPLCDGSHSK